MSERTFELSGPRCPYCGFLHTPDDPIYYRETTDELDCGECGKPFKVEIYHSTSWTCRAFTADELSRREERG